MATTELLRDRAAVLDVPPTSRLRLVPEGPEGPEGPSPAGRGETTDLFRLCDLVAEAVGAPVTIEDRQLHVLAFSDHDGVDDLVRIRSIVSRRVPDAEVARLRSAGAIAHVLSGEGPWWVPPAEPGGLGRVVFPVRGDRQTFGAIWVATPTDLTPEQHRRLSRLSRVAAQYFVQEHLDADQQAKVEARTLAEVLEGRAPASVTDALGLARGACVLAVRPDPGAKHHDESADVHLQRLSGALRMHVLAAHPAGLVAPVDGVVYAVVPTHGADAAAQQRARAVAERFAQSAAGTANDVAIGIGGPARDAASLVRARADADRVLRLARLGELTGRVNHAEDVQMRILMNELRDVVHDRELRLVGPVAVIAAHDAASSSQLLATLEVWLNSFGDINAVAGAMHVHPNTARYRLRRAVEVGGLDLQSSEARFEAMMQIRLLRA